MPGSRTKACAIFTPKGLSVSSRILRISSLISLNSPDEVSMIPIAPAFETAEASCARAIQPIGACTIGYLTPSSLVIRFSKRISSSSDRHVSRRFPLDPRSRFLELRGEPDQRGFVAEATRDLDADWQILLGPMERQRDRWLSGRVK